MKETIGVCLIGAGRAGMIHANNFRAKVPWARLVAVSDPSEQACRNACRELEIERYYLDHREALQDSDIGAVVIVAPTQHHRRIAVDCANAGKHILCEKPMAMTSVECDEMIAAAEKNHVNLQIGFMRRFDESFRKAKEAVDAGEIGDVVHIRSITRGPSKPQEWMYDIEKSNGPLAEVNSHDIDCIRWFSGSEVQTLYAVAGNYRNREIAKKYPGFYDNVVMTGKLKNGAQFTVEGAQYVEYGYDARVEVLGTKGVVTVGRSEAYHIQVINKNGRCAPFVASWTSLFKDAYLEEDIRFIRCVVEGTEPEVTGVDGKMAVTVVEAGNRSIRENAIVML